MEFSKKVIFLFISSIATLVASENEYSLCEKKLAVFFAQRYARDYTYLHCQENILCLVKNIIQHFGAENIQIEELKTVFVFRRELEIVPAAYTPKIAYNPMLGRSNVRHSLWNYHVYLKYRGFVFDFDYHYAGLEKKAANIELIKEEDYWLNFFGVDQEKSGNLLTLKFIDVSYEELMFNEKNINSASFFYWLLSTKRPRYWAFL